MDSSSNSANDDEMCLDSIDPHGLRSSFTLLPTLSKGIPILFSHL